MGVPGTKAAENNFPVIRPVIPIGVCKEDEVLSLAKVDSSITQGESSGHVEPVCEHQSRVDLSVVVTVLQNKKFVVGDFGWNGLRIDKRAENPEPSLRAPPHRNRIGDSVLLRGEKGNSIPFGDSEGSELGLARVITRGGSDRIILWLGKQRPGVYPQKENQDELLH